MNIIIGSDHAGFDLKEECRSSLERTGGHGVKDIGVFNRDSCDYPKIAHQVAQSISKGEYDRGILICGTGIGMSIAANRHPGARAALCLDLFSAKMCRLHNDANILTMGARILGAGLALEIMDVFLKTPFEGGRHKARIDQIEC